MSKRSNAKRAKAQQRRAEKRAARNENREEQRFQEQIIKSARENLVYLPSILGADFQSKDNDLEVIRQKINALPKTDYKKRVLFISEASFLNTGFSTYMREVLKRLHSTNKYIIAEFGSYGASKECDPRTKDISWQYYHNLPSNGIEEHEYKKDYNENQFGKWRLSYVLADFKPDIILMNRDNWMDTHVLKNQFRENFLVYWMPTVDGYPQKWEWLADYSTLDGLFTYSWFGKKVLEEQSRTSISKRIGIPPLNVRNVMQAATNIDIFKPMAKNEVRKILGIPEHMRFVGTVMRNQPRKLFTRIIEAFREFKEEYPVESKDVFLLLHTSIPDVGWDIPECVRQNGLDEFVVYSYLCSSCGLLAVADFCGSPAICPGCGKNTFHTPNTQIGYSEEHLACIYNLMDIYMQGSIAEGDGMPINEAKACGVPCLVSDYSAMYEKARNGGALPINNLSENNKFASYTEHETMQWRSLFDREDLAEKLALLMGNEAKRSILAKEARECAEKYYNWDLCAAKWEYEIDISKLKDRSKTWDRNIEIKSISQMAPPDSSNDSKGYKEWLTWCYQNILGRKGIDADGLQYWTRILDSAGDKDKAKQELEKHFRKMIESENKSKMVLQNPNIALSDPVGQIKAIIEENENIKI